MEKANQTEQKLESNFETEMILAFKNEEQLDRQRNMKMCQGEGRV